MFPRSDLQNNLYIYYVVPLFDLRIDLKSILKSQLVDFYSIETIPA